MSDVCCYCSYRSFQECKCILNSPWSAGKGVINSIDGIAGTIDELSLCTFAGGGLAWHYVTTSVQGWNASKFQKRLAVAQTVRLYADPETVVEINVHADEGGQMFLTLSGYFVDVK